MKCPDCTSENVEMIGCSEREVVKGAHRAEVYACSVCDKIFTAVLKYMEIK